MVSIGEKILEPSDIKFMNYEPYVFDVDHVAKVKSGLYYIAYISTSSRKKSTKLSLEKVT